MKKAQKSYYGSIKERVVWGDRSCQLCEGLFITRKKTGKKRKKTDFFGSRSSEWGKNYHLYRAGEWTNKGKGRSCRKIKRDTLSFGLEVFFCMRNTSCELLKNDLTMGGGSVLSRSDFKSFLFFKKNHNRWKKSDWSKWFP